MSFSPARETLQAVPLERHHMPTDYSISLRAYNGRGTPLETRIPADYGPPQSMRGFEETYRNIIDYIVRITYRIWEDRDVEYIADTYSSTSRVYDDYGLQLGNRKIISDTHHTTRAFSDIQLIADEIVWAGDDQVGFHTSHRTIIRGTNDGHSRYAAATGRPVDVLVIANCVARDNQIFLEHVLYNNSALLLQMGLELESQVARLVADPPAGWPREADTWRRLRSAASPEQPLYIASPVDGFDVDRFVRSTFDALWNDRNSGCLANSYAPGFRFLGPTGRASAGAGAYRLMLGALHDSFPDLQAQMDEVYWMGNEREGYLTSERWSAEGSHLGDGLYGKPTGRPVQIWGITQHHIVDGRIVAEWMLFNELDLMMQLGAR